jgi:hypothetical protein
MIPACSGVIMTPLLSPPLVSKECFVPPLPPLPEVRRFESSSGVRIYRISSEAFPGFVVHV